MFQLSFDEYNSLKFQFGILKKGQHSKYLPFVFTEQGVAMLSGVLNSKRAVQVNIAIMRTFTKLRSMISSYEKLAEAVRKIEAKVGQHDKDIIAIIGLIEKLHEEPSKKKTKLGF